jgi:prepilin signal peptidase PulO-like enzyme (type II secretory pathway)
MEWFLYIFFAGLGLIVGSFLNVVVFRFGFGETAQARSRCMACDAELVSADLIPILSYVLLLGRCRTCGSRLSAQYPIVEAVTGLLFLLAYVLVPPQAALWSILAFVALLVCIAAMVALVAYDIRHTLVPYQFLIVLTGAALAAPGFQSVGAGTWPPLLDGLLGGVCLAGFFALLHALTRGKGMGMGDAYIAGAIGLVLGFSRGIEAVMLAVWIGTAFYLALFFLSRLSGGLRLSFRSVRVSMSSELPFAPFLSVGFFLALFTPISPLDAAAALIAAVWALAS